MDYLAQILQHIFGPYQLQGMGPSQRIGAQPARLVDYVRSLGAGTPIAGNMNQQIAAALKGKLKVGAARSGGTSPPPSGVVGGGSYGGIDGGFGGSVPSPSPTQNDSSGGRFSNEFMVANHLLGGRI